MPSPSSRLDDQGAGFVVLPLSILFHPDLTDADKVLLLVLDQYANREGFRDGTVQASDREIAARMGKSVSSVRISLHRIEAIRPPILAFEMASPRRRDSIRLRYDRYGDASVATVGPHVPVPQDEDSDARFRVSPVAAYQETHDTVAVVPAKSSDTRKRVSACDTRIRALLPIERRVLVPPPEGDDRIRVSHAELDGTATPESTVASHATPLRAPETLDELIAWIPTVTDRQADVERLVRKAPHWLAQLNRKCPEHSGSTVDWITDALIAASDKNDIVPYAAKILGAWAAQGGRPDVELAPTPVPSPPTPPGASSAIPAASPPRAFAGFSRLSKAERNHQAAEARRASMAKLFPSKEASDGSR